MSLEAWRLLEANYERVLAAPDDLDARAAMQMGAFYAGTAIELSMLGATHACANPLTARYGTTHGDAIAILLPHVVRWNASAAETMYAELLRVSTHATHATREPHATPTLAARLSQLASAGGLPRTLTDAGASSSDLEALAARSVGTVDRHVQPAPLRRRRGAGDLPMRALRYRFRALVTLRQCDRDSVRLQPDRDRSATNVMAAISREPATHGRRILAARAHAEGDVDLRCRRGHRVVCCHRRRDGLCRIRRG